jgi:hypothetical protein
MKILMFIYIVALFVILTPGQFLTLPSATTQKLHVNIVHGLIFAFVLMFVNKAINSRKEKFNDVQKKNFFDDVNDFMDGVKNATL